MDREISEQEYSEETTCESAPYVLKNLGYSTHAVHNNEANFYGRRSIFPNLGFDTFTSAEYMAEENDKNPLGWTKDEVLTDEIIKCLDSTEGPDYVYTISTQGHGAYPEEQLIDDPQITVTGAATEAQNNQWEYYCNEIHEMDNFVKELSICTGRLSGGCDPGYVRRSPSNNGTYG